jgi:hypothetical protein
MPYADPEKARAYAARFARERRARLKAAGKPELPHLTDAERAHRRSEYSKASTYGVGTAELRRWYAATWAEQAGACAICRAPFDGDPATPVQRGRGGSRKGMAYVDHDHDSGKLRGLLCHRCNLQVGYVEKNTACAIAAVEYVLKHLDAG